MIQRKRAGMPVPTERIHAPAPNVVSLIDALKRSLAAEEAKAPEPAKEAGCRPTRDAVADSREGQCKRESQGTCATCGASTQGRVSVAGLYLYEN
jgi:hypothetical protein